MWSQILAPDKSQAISFKVIKACYPFTIKGWLFSLLCCQPEAFPVYLKTLTSLVTRRWQYLPLIWNGQAKAQPPNRFILSLTNTKIHKTRRSYREQALPGHTNRYTYQALLSCNIKIISFYLWVKKRMQKLISKSILISWKLRIIFILFLVNWKIKILFSIN